MSAVSASRHKFGGGGSYIAHYFYFYSVEVPKKRYKFEYFSSKYQETFSCFNFLTSPLFPQMKCVSKKNRFFVNEEVGLTFLKNNFYSVCRPTSVSECIQLNSQHLGYLLAQLTCIYQSISVEMKNKRYMRAYCVHMKNSLCV